MIMSTKDAGKIGAQKRNEKLSSEQRSAASKQAAETRRKNEGTDAFKRMGAQSHKNDDKTSK